MKKDIEYRYNILRKFILIMRQEKMINNYVNFFLILFFRLIYSIHCKIIILRGKSK